MNYSVVQEFPDQTKLCNLGVYAAGHFEDDQLNVLLGLDGRTQFALYAATAGKKQEE